MTDLLSRLAALTAKNAVVKFDVQCDKCGDKDFRMTFGFSPREEGLIALVQDAAGEIERLHSEIIRYRTALNKIAHPNHYKESADTLEEAVDIALAAVVIKDRQRLKPQEPTS